MTELQRPKALHLVRRCPLATPIIISALCATAEVPDVTQCSVVALPNPVSGHILCVPDGTGDELGSAITSLNVYVRNSVGDPIQGLPAQDVWLGSADPLDFYICASGSVADGPSDASGLMSISGALRIGGYTGRLSGATDGTGGIAIYVFGQAIPGSVLNLKVNSTDLSGDGAHSLLDVTAFSDTYNSGVYHFRADFDYNGVVNLSDWIIFTEHYLAAGDCP